MSFTYPAQLQPLAIALDWTRHPSSLAPVSAFRCRAVR